MRERLQKVPLKPGVYLYKDQEGQIIYVGKAKALRNRMRSYFQSPEKLHPKVRAMMARVKDFDYIVTATEVEALILENNLIKAWQPRYNIDLRDDKTYPYVKITTGQKFPRVCIAREAKDGVSRYFGPYTDVTSLRETLKVLAELFPLRTCKNLQRRERPCLNHDMGRCLAPCMGKVTEEEYASQVERIIAFMEGQHLPVIKECENRMREAAANMDYEKAARWRDQINNIRKIAAEQKTVFDNPYNLDLIAQVAGERESLLLVLRIRAGQISGKDFFWLKQAIEEENSEVMDFFIRRYYDNNQDIPREIVVNQLPADAKLLECWLSEKTGRRITIKKTRQGDKRHLLDMAEENAAVLWEEKYQQNLKNRRVLLRLSQVLDLEVVPERIECYDISHLAGSETVASMVVFTEGEADKKAYRRFKIKTEQNNDFASLAETLKRRFKQAQSGNAAFLPLPDLIIIDGGLGQVNSVQSVLNDLQIDIPVFGLAKKHEEIWRPGCGQPIRLTLRDEGLKLLQRLRDEAHRFALDLNRLRRAKKTTASELDNIAGIGPARKKALFNSLGSVSKIRQADLESLSVIPGMNKAAAKKVYDYFHHDANNTSVNE
ncbi:MAG TPA: excinuclease ABC subunit UvrC [Syntrophomonadaceae bacterium]|nr:excinuclease ABC subunit UvrC [Syntrophomonadaceae bacterium]HPR93858.1 excinuclease ABC subunit UvrC [Syntrophomonadaceae bacterium]